MSGEGLLSPSTPLSEGGGGSKIVHTFRRGGGAEGNLQVSKWLHVPVLLSIDELRSLFAEISPCYIVATSRILREEEAVIEQQRWLSLYETYIERLSLGDVPGLDEVTLFNSVLARCLDDFYAIEVGKDSQPLKDSTKKEASSPSVKSKDPILVRASHPVVQVQSHTMGFSALDQQLRPMQRGKESISWGLQFSYPLIYQDPKSGDVYQALKDPQFKNREIFQTIQKWMRSYTRSLPLIYGGRHFTSPVRIGYECMKWVNHHPGLLFHGLAVDVDRALER